MYIGVWQEYQLGKAAEELAKARLVEKPRGIRSVEDILDNSPKIYPMGPVAGSKVLRSRNKVVASKHKEIHAVKPEEATKQVVEKDFVLPNIFAVPTANVAPRKLRPQKVLQSDFVNADVDQNVLQHFQKSEKEVSLHPNQDEYLNELNRQQERHKLRDEQKGMDKQQKRAFEKDKYYMKLAALNVQNPYEVQQTAKTQASGTRTKDRKWLQLQGDAGERQKLLRELPKSNAGEQPVSKSMAELRLQKLQTLYGIDNSNHHGQNKDPSVDTPIASAVVVKNYLPSKSRIVNKELLHSNTSNDNKTQNQNTNKIMIRPTNTFSEQTEQMQMLNPHQSKVYNKRSSTSTSTSTSTNTHINNTSTNMKNTQPHPHSSTSDDLDFVNAILELDDSFNME